MTDKRDKKTTTQPQLQPKNSLTALRKALPYVVAVVLFWGLSALYFAPQYSGEVLVMHDMVQFDGMSRDVQEHNQLYDEDPQWTGAAFSGMPSYMNYVRFPKVITRASYKFAAFMGEPTVMIMMAMLCFWLMLLMWGVNPWLGIIPSLAYGLSTYFMTIIGAGHISKMWALAYAPLLIGAVVYTLRGGNKLFGCSVAALAASLQLGYNHPQITWYFCLVIAAFWISEFIYSYKEKTLKKFWKSTAVMAVAAMLAVGSNFATLYYTMQYSPETTRGGSELAEAGSVESSGLDLEYATAWSYGKTESFNMFIPNLMGGASDGGFASDGAVAQSLTRYGARSMATTLPAYWGPQPMTSGPVYIGAVVFFLAVMGLIVLEGRRKWWLLAVSIVALFLSWGHNMMWFTELMFRIAPGYDKFRTVSMALVVLEWTLPVLAALLLAELWRGGVERTKLDKGLKWATISLGGVALFFILFGGSLFGFSSSVDSQLPADVAEAMRAERRAMMSGDAWRSLLFVLLSAATVWAFSREKIGRKGLVAIMAALVCVDMIPVDLRFLSHDDFQPASAATITPTSADLVIMEDTELGYRVANLAVSTFNDGTTSYFHRSVGGYHGAKLSRYQDLIDRYLSSLNTDIYSMLNTKYFIVPNEETGEPEPMLNPDANGAAWFVEAIEWVDKPDVEIEMLGLMDNKSVAVADSRFRDMVSGPMGGGEITLTEYYPNRLVYDYTSAEGGVAVFSEIYYNKGWTAYIDGEEAPYFRADYVLRAMELPAGSHTVEFRFRAPHYPLIAGITLTFSWVIVAGIVVAAVVMIRNRRNDKEDGTTGEQEA